MQKYLDVMREALNKGIDKQSNYWRSHRSLHGWSSMNYPSTLSNPMLKRRPNPMKPENIAFTNLNKPISAPRDRVKRPLTAITSRGKRIAKPLPINHNYYKASKKELLLISDSDNEDSASEGIKLPIQDNNYVSEAYNLPQHHAPAPIRPTMTSYNYRRNINGSSLREDCSSLPPALGIDYTKRSSGMLTTTAYNEKIKFIAMSHKNSQYISPLKPVSAYAGAMPDPTKDPYNRRKVKQLDDISFESNDEIEEHKDHRRMPETTLTEENLKTTLTPDLKSLNLNNHYWLNNNFIDKIGRMAPNLVELSIRSLQVTTDTFVDLVKHMGLLKILDISNCKFLEEKAIIKLADTNQGIVRLKASGCEKAITDLAIQHLVEKSRCQMELLDLSYWSRLTDKGLSAFKEDNDTQIFKELYLNGINKATNAGFSSIISSCDKTLILLHMTLNDQLGVTGEVCKSIAKWFELQILDLTGWSIIGDDGIGNLASGSIIVEEKNKLIGLKNLKILKISSTAINDSSIIRLLKISDLIIHLEVSSCQNLTEYFFSQVSAVAQNLEFLDMNMIPSMTQKLFDEFKEKNPKLNIRRYAQQIADPKDNGLRRPLKIAGKKVKKTKKKGKKKKK